MFLALHLRLGDRRDGIRLLSWKESPKTVHRWLSRDKSVTGKLKFTWPVSAAERPQRLLHQIVAYQSSSAALGKGMHFHPLRHGIGGRFSG
jgi:hypothetical protein